MNGRQNDWYGILPLLLKNLRLNIIFNLTRNGRSPFPHLPLLASVNSYFGINQLLVSCPAPSLEVTVNSIQTTKRLQFEIFLVREQPRSLQRTYGLLLQYTH